MWHCLAKLKNVFWHLAMSGHMFGSFFSTFALVRARRSCRYAGVPELCIHIRRAHIWSMGLSRARHWAPGRCGPNFYKCFKHVPRFVKCLRSFLPKLFFKHVARLDHSFEDSLNSWQGLGQTRTSVSNSWRGSGQTFKRYLVSTRPKL